MQPSNPWYWLLGLLAGGATWPEGFALAFQQQTGLYIKPWLWHWEGWLLLQGVSILEASAFALGMISQRTQRH